MPNNNEGQDKTGSKGASGFDSLEESSELPAAEGARTVLSRNFPLVTKRQETTPHGFFDDPSYYKKAMENEGEQAKKLHSLLQEYIAGKDSKERGEMRQRIIIVYWEFLLGVAKRAVGELSAPKKYLLRFGILHPGLLDADQKDLFARIVVDNDLDQPIYYLDEWFKAVGTGVVRPSATDEVKTARSDNAAKLRQLQDKALGRRDGVLGLMATKDHERLRDEGALKERISTIFTHEPLGDLMSVKAAYSDGQKKAIGEVQDLLKTLLREDRELDTLYKEYVQADGDVQYLEDKIEREGVGVVDTQALDTEFDTVRQMAKLVAGRQGNQFPLLTREYFRGAPMELAVRENVITELAWIEAIDPEAYCRVYRNKMNRVVPFVILIPSYGDAGVCWDPFDRYNRASSRGRLVLPLYPKKLRTAVLSAVGDLRWQTAKERASYYWMEEGLTGNYYQWFNARKLKGDLKEAFIEDYITWITKESEGMPRLDKELRGIFWRYIPFAQEVKDKLKTRSTIYQELYQRDVNRSMSDGY
jgi:hypothetical protein